MVSLIRQLHAIVGLDPSRQDPEQIGNAVEINLDRTILNFAGMQQVFNAALRATRDGSSHIERGGFLRGAALTAGAAIRRDIPRAYPGWIKIII